MKVLFLFIVQIWMARAEFCSQELRMKLEGNFSVRGKIIDHNGVTYPEGAHWSVDGETFGCPCQLEDRPCIPLCSKGEAEAENLAVPDAEFQLEVWDGESNKTVKLSEHFIPKENLNCTHVGFQLYQDGYKILTNGSIQATTVNDEIDESVIIGPAEYCIMNNQSEVIVIVCEIEEIEG